jgi:hypothetical protein
VSTAVEYGEQSHDEVVECFSDSFVVNTRFNSVNEAKEAAVQFAQVPLSQRSMKKFKYVVFQCFRGGTYEKKSSNVDSSQQRNRGTQKCACPFEVRLRKLDTSQYEVYVINSTHNHDMYSEDELASLPSNRSIPEEVKQKMLDLHALGNFSARQIMHLIEHEFF